MTPVLKVVGSAIAFAALGEVVDRYVIEPYLRPKLPKAPEFKKREPGQDTVVQKAESLGFI